MIPSTRLTTALQFKIQQHFHSSNVPCTYPAACTTLRARSPPPRTSRRSEAVREHAYDGLRVGEHAAVPRPLLLDFTLLHARNRANAIVISPMAPGGCRRPLLANAPSHTTTAPAIPALLEAVTGPLAPRTRKKEEGS